MIDRFLTTDPFNKRGKVGTITNLNVYDEKNADITIEIEDGVIGIYESGTFETLE